MKLVDIKQNKKGKKYLKKPKQKVTGLQAIHHTYASSILLEQLVIFGVQDNVVTDRVLDLIMLMAKHCIFRCRCLKVTPNFCLFFKGSQAKSTHRETYLVNEGQPHYVFLALVPILPTDQ